MTRRRTGPARRARGGLLRLPSCIAILLCICTSAPASQALVWPDVAVRVERDLSAADPATRLAAARELVSIGAARGAALAITALGDDDDDVRLAAADAAIRLHAPGATDGVVGWLNAPDARLRREACEVARALPDPRAVAPLARTLGDPSADVRSAAAEALGNQAVPDAVPPLLGRLDDSTPAVRVAIVAALARLSDPRAVVPLVGKAGDSSPDVRQAVARALGDLGDPRAAAALVPALRDQSADVRREALIALGRLRADDAVDAIAPFAADHTASLQLAALEALGRIATPEALRVLVGALSTADEASPPLEATPARSALVAAGAAAVPVLRALLAGSPSATAAAGAAWVLGELHAQGEASTLTAALRRGVLPPAIALHALAGAGTASEVPVVLEFVTDPSPLVRGEALDATTALLDPHDPDGRAVEPLAAALRDGRPSPRERARITTLIGRTGAARAAPLLVPLVQAHDREIQIAAIDALGMLGPAGADEGLLDGLASPDAEIRLHAAMALSEAGGPTARDALLAKLAGDDEVDRPALLTALGGILTRVPTAGAVSALNEALSVASAPARDAILEALGRAPIAAVVRSLAGAARSEEPGDRSAAATLCAAHRGDSAATALARTLMADPDPEVRAQAAWSLGTLGDGSDLPRLEAITRAPGADGAFAATNAAAAMGRIAAHLKQPDAAAQGLCPLVSDPRVYVRANALVGLALGHARCPGTTAERVALQQDPREEVRTAAALLLTESPNPEDLRALDRCAHTDASVRVAAQCRSHPAFPVRTHPVLVYVVSEGATPPRPGAAYALLMADGTVRMGSTDRRGGVFDPVAPEGVVRLLPPF